MPASKNVISEAELLKGVIDCVTSSLAIGADGIHEKTKIIADLGADSLDFMDVIFQLETRFGVSLQKEDFDLFKRTHLSRDEAVRDGLLSSTAKEKIQFWLPDLPVAQEIKPSDLSKYVAVETIVKVIKEHLRLAKGEK